MKKNYEKPALEIINISNVDIFMFASFEISFDAFSEIFDNGDNT